MKFTRLLLAVLVLALAGPAVVPTPAGADDAAVNVVIESVSSASLDLAAPDDEVILHGKLTNTGKAEIGAVSIHFWRRLTPISTTEELHHQLTQPHGSPLFDQAAGQVAVPLGNAPLTPGQSVDFSVKARIAELSFHTPEAVYLIGADVRGILGNEVSQSLARDLLPIAATTAPTTSTALVTLTATPRQLPDGTFLDDTLIAELSGPLEKLLASAERPGVAAAIDPALYDAVATLATEYEVADVDYPGNELAAAWIKRVDALAAQGRLWQLPYGNPNLTIAQASGELPDVLAWMAQGTTTLASLPRAAVLETRPNDELLGALSGYDLVVVRGASGGRAGSPNLLGATSLTGLPSGQRLSRMLAEELLSAQPLLYLIDTPQAADDDALDPQQRQRVLPVIPATGQLSSADEISPPTWGRVTAELKNIRDNAELVGELSESPVNLARLGPGAFSFPDEQAALDWLARVSPEIVAADKLKLVAAKSFVMGSRTNTFPATLTNELDIPVTVRVVFTSEAPQRIWVPTLEEVSVAPGQSLTLSISPKAETNGVTMVHAQLYTTSGRAIGDPVAIEVTASDFGRIGWVIILISGAVVVGGTAWRIRTVRRERAKVTAN